MRVLFIKMKQKFSIKWKASRQPRKQRKYRFNAPLHVRGKFMSVLLDKPLRERYGRNIELRKGDEVKVMRGSFKGKQGKVESIERKNERISIEGITRVKKDGTNVPVWFNPSKVKIISLDESDKRRFEKSVEKSKEKTEEKNEKKETKKVKKTKKKTGEKNAHKKK